jgi:hypothetical protein
MEEAFSVRPAPGLYKKGCDTKANCQELGVLTGDDKTAIDRKQLCGHVASQVTREQAMKV